MPRIGGAYAMYGMYQESNGVVSYEAGEGGYLGRMVSANLSNGDDTDNDWYGDGAVGETDDAFAVGNVELELGEMLTETAQKLLDVDVVALTGNNAISGVTDEGASMIKYKANPNIPYIGIGTVVESRYHGVDYYTPVIINKAKLKQPSTEVQTTKPGKTIDWGNIRVQGKFFKDDAATPGYKTECTPLTSMAQALAFLRHVLGVPEPTSSSQNATT